jgi:type IV secretory pathway VirB4 component
MTNPRPAHFWRRRGLRLSRHRATTAHVCALYPFHATDGLGPRGIYVGEDVSASGAAWCYDPFQLYTDGILTSPNILVLGAIGSGKSSAVKTLLYRSIGLLGSPSGQPRWCAILDPKGEYGPLADALGLTRIDLHPGGTTRLNPLDPGPHTTTLDDLRARRTQTVAALAAAVLGRELRPVEDATLSWVIDTITQPGTPTAPTLVDVANLLATPTSEMTARSQFDSSRELAREVMDVRYGLGKLLDGQLRGMFDGPSTASTHWGGRGVVIDLSAVHQDPAALTVVMIAATSWLQSLLAAPESADVPRRVQVLEEIWALLGSERVAKYFQSCQKLARAYGVANISVAHRLADLRAQADDGTTTAKVATGILADTQTQILFRQPADQIPEATQLLGLTSYEARRLPTLPQGRALWRVGTLTAEVQHRLAPAEHAICETNQQMKA